VKFLLALVENSLLVGICYVLAPDEHLVTGDKDPDLQQSVAIGLVCMRRCEANGMLVLK
jgi:hypothetical protein